MVWEMDGYEFITICGILLEEVKRANGQATGPAMSLESVQNIGKLMESFNGRKHNPVSNPTG